MAEKAFSPKTCICKICQASFIKKHKNGPALYCGPECAKAAYYAQFKIRREKRGIGVIGSPFTCTNCGLVEPRTGRKQKYCPPCSAQKLKDRFKRYLVRHKEKVLARNRIADRIRNAEPERKQRAREKKYSTLRRRTVPKANLDHRMSTMFNLALKGKKAGRRWESLVDYSIADLIRHIERQFLKGMSWSNMGEWHVDHVLPKSMFKYDDENSEEFKACWSLTNLRPLWSKDNLEKHARRTHLI